MEVCSGSGVNQSEVCVLRMMGAGLQMSNICFRHILETARLILTDRIEC